MYRGERKGNRMTVMQVYLTINDSQRVVILELDKVLYEGQFYLIPSKFLHNVVQKMYIDIQKEAIVLCI